MPSTPCVESTKTVLHLLTLSLLLKVLGSDGLRDVRLEAKRYARLGEDSLLRCSYDLEHETLYAVKYYKGSEEFYRFVPKELRPKQVFPVLGISVDYFQSDEHHVILKNVSFDTTGKYKCVVTGEGNFQTLVGVKDITVVAIGYDSPRLYLEKLHYRPGDTGQANCSVERTIPPVNISWFINDKLVVRHDKIITRVVEDNQDSRFTSTISELFFHVPNHLYKPIVIKCVGQLFDLYQEASIINIQPKGPSHSRQRNSPETPDPLQHSTAPSKLASFSLTTINFQVALFTQLSSRIFFPLVR